MTLERRLPEDLGEIGGWVKGQTKQGLIYNCTNTHINMNKVYIFFF